MKHTVFDARKCQLREGPIWHPDRQELFWFDILDRELLSSSSDDSFTKKDPAGKTFFTNDTVSGQSNVPVEIDGRKSDPTE